MTTGVHGCRIDVLPARQVARESPWTPVDVLGGRRGIRTHGSPKTQRLSRPSYLSAQGSLPRPRLARNPAHAPACRSQGSLLADRPSTEEPVRKVVETQPAQCRGPDHTSRHDMTTDPTTTHTTTGTGAASGWTAPPNTVGRPFAPPPPPPPPIGAERPAPATASEALDEMTELIAGARGALLASVDGFALAQSESMPNEAAHAAMLAAAIGLAHQLVRMGGGMNSSANSSSTTTAACCYCGRSGGHGSLRC